MPNRKKTMRRRSRKGGMFGYSSGYAGQQPSTSTFGNMFNSAMNTTRGAAGTLMNQGRAAADQLGKYGHRVRDRFRRGMGTRGQETYPPTDPMMGGPGPVGGKYGTKKSKKGGKRTKKRRKKRGSKKRRKGGKK